MKEIQDRQKHQNIIPNNIRKWVVFYGDSVIRGLLSFFLVGIVLYAILSYFFHLSFVYIFIIIFLVSIILSPVWSKVKFAEKGLNKYEKLLKKVFNL